MSDVLIIEDNQDTAAVVKEYLEMNDIRCDVAVNGAEALQKFKAQKFKLLLMDVKLPDIDGVEVAKQCREINNTVKLVFLTGHGVPGGKEAFGGEVRIIEKPCRPMKILEEVSQMI